MDGTSTEPRGTARLRTARGALALVVAATGIGLTVSGAIAMVDRAPVTRVLVPGGPATPQTRTGEPVTHLSPADVDPSVAQGVPRQVYIPRLDVRVPVIEIDAQGGTLVPPADPRVLGWWTGGAEVGARKGGAVVTGHTVHTGGGALDKLRTLKRDDVVQVTTARGRLEYSVRRVENWSKDELAARAAGVFSQDVRRGRLVLITCTDWNGSVYLGNTLAFARVVSVS